MRYDLADALDMLQDARDAVIRDDYETALALIDSAMTSVRGVVEEM